MGNLDDAKAVNSPERHEVSPPPHDMKPPASEYADVEGHTLYERKCIIVNKAIDEMGMGRYQWYIWSLCGFGYLLDLLWAQAFGLILSPLQQEFGFSGARPSECFARVITMLTRS